MDGVQNIILMMRKEEKFNPIKLKTWASQTISACLEAMVGVIKVHIGTSSNIRDSVF